MKYKMLQPVIQHQRLSLSNPGDVVSFPAATTTQAGSHTDCVVTNRPYLVISQTRVTCGESQRMLADLHTGLTLWMLYTDEVVFLQGEYTGSPILTGKK